MSKLTRRTLIGGAALSAAALPAPALPALHRRRSPSDKIRIGVVGLRGRGQSHIGAFERAEGSEVVALCDVDQQVLDKNVARFQEQGRKLAAFVDIREMLASDAVDAVALATPNHLHALHTVWACQAGKDVYCEKPVSHNLFEGRQAVAAAEKYGRIVASGTQGRSSTAIRDAFAWLHAGNLGAITYAWGTCFKPRQSIGQVSTPQEVPGHIAYDLWCGPRGVMPLNRKRLHYDWHWQFATGSGDLGNQGIHQMDICRWGLGRQSLAPRVLSVGGRFGYEDDGDTPNTQYVFLDYEPAPLIFEVRGLPRDQAAQKDGWGGKMDRRNGASIGASVHAEGGYVVVSSSYGNAKACDNEGRVLQEWKGSEDHFANFVAAVRARDASLLKSDIREGHLSSGLCHQGNDSYQLGVPAGPGAIGEAMGQEPHLATCWERFQGHLEANGVDLAKERATLGRWLVLDQETEQYVGDPEAEVLRRGSYAEGFEVPEQV